VAIKKLSAWDTLKYFLFGWSGFNLPVGEVVNCYKDRSTIDSVLILNNSSVDWGKPNEQQSALMDPGRVGKDGVGSGTPMQLGGQLMRSVTWGSGYGRYNQWRTLVPLPLDGGRYWITGYPSTAYDKRCIIVGPDRLVYELIQFDQDAPVRDAGLPQQALNRGTWKDGFLIDGVPTSASGLPGHAYIWGRGSMEDPHVQSFTVEDYIGGDGTDEFEETYPNGPVCGSWFYLPTTSESYIKMVAKGGQCEARAKALATHGARLVDRGGRTSFLTQAGTWARATNINQFTINLNDLRLVV
jgi:hypothetical protein